MDSNQNNTLAPLDLSKMLDRFFKMLKRTWILVLALAVLLAGANLLRARISYRPVYRCQALFSIGSGYIPNNIFSTTHTLYYDSSTAQSLASAFPDLLRTDYMRDMIEVRLGSGSINGSISASAVAGTNLMEMQVTSTSAQDAYDILNAVIDCYPQAARYMADYPTIILLDAPVLPSAPSNSFSVRGSLVRGGIMGLVLGLGLTFGLSMLIRTIGSTDDLKAITNLPILTTFPQVSPKHRRKDRKTSLISAADNEQVAESLRALRTKVRKQLAEKDGNIVLLTSTVPGEGKTTISANLAISLAAEGHRVVLVDADLRNQSIARIFRSSQEDNGLLYCLNHPEHPVMECLKNVPGSKLYYISGASTSMRHYTIDGKALRPILDILSENFDYVIVDTPPCSVVSDTTLLTRFADCVLYVIRLDCANRNQILDSITGLYQRDISLTGCILNGVHRSSRTYGYGYGYGYGSHYYHQKSRYGRNQNS
ncbi:MAG: polysaccharide biosynthesis tyrosine autokinase [Oscillospiraceae bacterium]|nr:polysaccharide biosynthesis tyrosine autokinase [Oscillospiraceae bacterium]